jgi:outer membrane receptor protein involved in Fe transport
MTRSQIPGRLFLPFLLSLAALLPAPSPALGQDSTAPEKVPAVSERIEVTATRVPEDVEPVPSSITIVTGDELRARGAYDLQSALALTAGVTIAPGGDTGPASSIPEIWGLREFDAFLLVVDGVPAGGAFNPALPTLDLNGVERIEILRGAAPVMYGATSFVGVIHVIHRAAEAIGGTARVYGGSYGSGGAAASTGLPAIGNYHQSLVVDGEKQGFKDDRTGINRGHLLYRGEAKVGEGAFHIDFDGGLAHQKPPSPTSVEGPGFNPLTPIDSNVNPRGSKIDENRYQLTGGYDRRLGAGTWSTTLALTRTDRTVARGFLTEVSTDDPNANGFRQDLTVDDLYFDSHIAFDLRQGLRLVAGIDHLYGNADLHSGDFDYFTSLDGREVPSLSELPPAGDLKLKDKRNFSGLYLQTEWTPTPRWRFQVGGRLNHTSETQDTHQGEVGEPADVTSADRTVTRGSGTAGLSWLAWQSGRDGLWLYADYRNTFKPAALDFGPDASGDILKPETAESYEIGAKGLCGDRLRWDFSVFQMDFSNLVVAQLVNGFPGLVNAGHERFRGFELETDYSILPDLRWQLGYSYHDARYQDFVGIFDDPDPVQLRGNRLPFSARNMASTGFTYAPARGLSAWALYNWVDSRFLDEVNEVLAPSYGTLSAGIGYSFDRFGIRIEGFNLNDKRAPISLSELGGGQVYLLPARSLRVTLDTKF